MEYPLTYYYLVGALLLMVVCGAILLGELMAWRRKCKNESAAFGEREKQMQAEIDTLRNQFDEISRENHDVEEELKALHREIADRDVALDAIPPKKLDVMSILMQNDGAQIKGDNNQMLPPSSIYNRFIDVVEEQLGNSSLQIDEIGQRLGLSRVQLYRRLKAETGMTPNELLRTYRLAKAARLLTTTDLTVAEIAYRVGFSSPSYFSRCFREQFETLPLDLRNAARK